MNVKKYLQFQIGFYISAALSGAFIAFAAQGSTMAAYNLLANPDTYGLGRLVVGIVFPVGLMFVVMTNSHLFTGKVYVIGEMLLDKKIQLRNLLRDWVLIYIWNFVGALLVVHLIYYSDHLDFSNGLLKEVTIKIALHKVQLSFLSAFFLGILCNWIVCLAIYMTRKASDTVGKLLSCYFPIFLFATAGFEHSIANMYYIPIGVIAAAGSIPELTWGTCFFNNLLPVTLGNIVGGFLFVAMAHYYSEKFLKLLNEK